jgi:hypothetical protein
VKQLLQTILDLQHKFIHFLTRLIESFLLPHGNQKTPSTVSEILASLRKEHFEPRHEAKAWGDWIYLDSYTTVISIECNRGLSSSATIEHGEGEEEGEPIPSILRAFGRLGWHGIDDDGEFPLV